MEQTRRRFLKRFGAAAGGAALIPAGRASTTNGVVTKTAPVSRSSSWSEIQKQFMLDPDIIYMNTGTEGSLPRPVYEAYTNALARFTASPTDSSFLNDDFNYFQEKNRKKVAKFMGAEMDEIVLTGNTTMGTNVVLFGLDYQKGDEIITTYHDHIAEISPSKVLAERRGVKLTQLIIPSPPRDKDEIITIFRRAIRRSKHRPKVLMICHINFTTGLRMPVVELCQLAKEHDMISVVDGAHGLGMLDLDMKELGCDYYAAAGHKFLNCLPGTGVLYMKGGEKNPRGLWPVLSQFYDFRDEDDEPFDLATQLQTRGQNDTAAMVAMAAAAEWHTSVGKRRIEDRVLDLNDYLRRRVVETWGERSLFVPAPGKKHRELSSGLATFSPDVRRKYEKEFVDTIWKKMYEEHKIWIRWTHWPATASDVRRDRETYAMRVSTHIFNDEDQIDAMIETVESVARGV